MELVLRPAPGNRRPHEIARPGEIERSRRHQIHPPAPHARGALEIHDFGVESVAEPLAGPESVVRAHCEGRNSGIGPVRFRQRAVDGLVLLCLAIDPPVLIAERERGAPLDECDARAFRALGEVLEVLAVADVRGVDDEMEVVR